MLRYVEELTILFTSTNGLAQSHFPAFEAGGSTSLNENLTEWAQTFPYTRAGEEIPVASR